MNPLAEEILILDVRILVIEIPVQRLMTKGKLVFIETIYRLQLILAAIITFQTHILDTIEELLIRGQSKKS